MDFLYREIVCTVSFNQLLATIFFFPLLFFPIKFKKTLFTYIKYLLINFQVSLNNKKYRKIFDHLLSA